MYDKHAFSIPSKVLYSLITAYAFFLSIPEHPEVQIILFYFSHEWTIVIFIHWFSYFLFLCILGLETVQVKLLTWQ